MTTNSGLISVAGSIWKAGKDNSLVEEITSSVSNGKVVMDWSQPVTWTFTCDIADTTILTPYKDCVAPFLTLTYADGTVVTGQVGLFIVLPSPATSTALITTGQIEAHSLEWLLSVDNFDDTYNVAGGIDYMTAVVDLLKTVEGITNYALPPSGILTPGPFTWKHGTPKIEAANELLAGAGYYPITTDRVGVITSWPVQDLTAVTPAVTYSNATGNVVDAVQIEPLLDRFCNKVIISADDFERHSYVITLVNDNPANPTSTVNLGITVVQYQQLPRMATNTQAQLIAQRYLDEGSAVYNQIQLTVLPDPLRNPREVVAVDLVDNDGRQIASGNYHVTGYQIGFTPKDANLIMTLAQIVPHK